MNRLTHLAVTAILGCPTSGQDDCVLGVVRDVEGHAVDGAALRFYPSQPNGLVGRPGPSAPGPTTGRSRSNGRFRLEATAALGCLVAEHADSGMAIVWVETDVPRVVTLEDPATIRIADGTAVEWSIANTNEHGELCRIGNRQGGAIRLAPGRYRVLVRRDDQFELHDLSLSSGSSYDLAAPVGPGPRLETRGRPLGRVVPFGFDDVELPVDGNSVGVPRAEGIAKVVEHVRHGPCTARVEHWYDGTAVLRRLNSPEVRFASIAIHGDTADVTVESIDTGGENAIVRSRGMIDADGSAWFVPVEAPRVGFVTIRRPGSAPIVLRHPPPRELDLEFAPEARLSIRVSNADVLLEEPADVRVDQAPFGELVVRARTDRRGEVVIAGLNAGRTHVRITLGGLRPFEQTLELESGERRLTVELDVGLTLAGSVWLEGRPVANAIVELRDPTAPESTRLVTSDAHGAFRFRGLADRPFTLFAWHEAAADTWSARISNVSPEETVRMVLELEDPPLPSGR